MGARTAGVWGRWSAIPPADCSWLRRSCCTAACASRTSLCDSGSTPRQRHGQPRIRPAHAIVRTAQQHTHPKPIVLQHEGIIVQLAQQLCVAVAKRGVLLHTSAKRGTSPLCNSRPRLHPAVMLRSHRDPRTSFRMYMFAFSARNSWFSRTRSRQDMPDAASAATSDSSPALASDNPAVRLLTVFCSCSRSLCGSHTTCSPPSRRRVRRPHMCPAPHDRYERTHAPAAPPQSSAVCGWSRAGQTGPVRAADSLRLLP